MIFSVEERSSDINHWISCKNTVYDALSESLFNCRYEFLRNYTTDDGIDELEISTSVPDWFKPYAYDTELSSTTGLLLMSSFSFCGLLNGLSVSYLWFAELSFDAKLVL